MPVNYDELAEEYSRYREPDARIASAIWAHLEGAELVLNVGAGMGSYEPDNCGVLAVEPSEQMITLRPTSKSKIVRGSAESLPFDSGVFDASMAIDHPSLVRYPPGIERNASGDQRKGRLVHLDRIWG